MVRVSVPSRVALTGALLALAVVLLAMALCNRMDGDGSSGSIRQPVQDVVTVTVAPESGRYGAVGKDVASPSVTDGTNVASVDVDIVPALCPVAIEGASLESSLVNDFGHAWRYTSEVEVERMAGSLLSQLQRDGWTLLEANRMDLFGEAWGCVARGSQEDRVLLVVMVPEKVGGVDDEVFLSRVSVVQIGAG